MKPLLAISLALILGVQACPAENPVPFEGVSFSIDVEDSWKRMLGTRKNQIAVTLSVSNEHRGQRPSCESSIICLRLREDMYLLKEDIKALAEVAAAAKAKKAMKQEVPYQYRHPSVQEQAESKPLKTTYKSVLRKKGGDDWAVSIKRDGSPVEIRLTEIDELEKMLHQANNAILWYETLLTAPAIPKPTEIAKPPVGSITFFMGQIGQVSSGKIKFDIHARQGSDLHYYKNKSGLIHSLKIPARDDSQGGVTSWRKGALVMEDGFCVYEADWVRGMMVHITYAAAAAQKKESYSFIGMHGNLRYEVSADPDQGIAKLRIHPHFGESDLTHFDATFILDDARKIAAMINQAKEAEAWFEKNRELFITPVAP